MAIKDNLAKSGGSKATLDGVKLDGKLELSTNRIISDSYDIPFSFEEGRLVLYKNKLYALVSGGMNTYMYSYDGFHWRNEATLNVGYNTGRPMVLVFNDMIHVFGGSKNVHNTFDGKSWSTVSSDIGKKLGEGDAVVYKNEIHAFGYTSTGVIHYIYSGISWRLGSISPDFTKVTGEVSTVILNDKIYLYAHSNPEKLYLFDGTDWLDETGVPGINDSSKLLVVGDRLHIFGNGLTNDSYHISRSSVDNTSWTIHNPLSISVYGGMIISYENNIAVLGGKSSRSGIYVPKTFQILSMDSFDGQLNLDTTKIGDLPYPGFNHSASCIYKGELHIFGSSVEDYNLAHYKYNGDTWESVSELPEPLQKGFALEYFGSIYLINESSLNMYGYDSETKKWIKESTLPMNMSGGVVFKHDKYLHCVNGSHYAFFAGSWNEFMDIPEAFGNISTSLAKVGPIAYIFSNGKIYRGDLANADGWKSIGESSTNSQATYHVYKSRIHCFNGTDHYMADSSDIMTWNRVRSLPTTSSEATFINYGDAICMLGCGTDNIEWYQVTTSEWIQNQNTPINFMNSRSVIYHGKLHVFGGTATPLAHYVYDGYNWSRLDDIPYVDTDRAVVVHNDRIHLLGGNTSTGRKMHVSWDGENWITEQTLPFNFVDGSAVSFNGELHILGSSALNETSSHYRFNGKTWIKASTLPYAFFGGSAIVYHGKIHIIGSKSSAAASKYHYAYDGVFWGGCGDIPYTFYSGKVFECADKLFLLGSGENLTLATNLYSWNDTGYTKHVSLPYTYANGVCEYYKSKIHIMSTSLNTADIFSHYEISPCVSVDTFDGKDVVQKQGSVISFINMWKFDDEYYPSIPRLAGMYRDAFVYCKRTPVGSIPLFSIPMDGSLVKWSYAVHYEDKLWLFVEKQTSKTDVSVEECLYVWDGYTFKKSDISLPAEMCRQNPVIFKGVLNFFGASSRYTFENNMFSKQETLPFTHEGIEGSLFIVFKEEIHLFGGFEHMSHHYTLSRNGNGYTWTQQISSPIDMVAGCTMWSSDYSIILANRDSRYRYNNKTFTKVYDDSDPYIDNGVLVVDGIPTTLGHSTKESVRNLFAPVYSYKVNLWN